MAIISSGQLTLTDLNDSKQIYLYLQPNVQQQIYDPNGSGNTAYSPNFTVANLVISPQIYIAGGNGTDLTPPATANNPQIISVTWYAGSSDSGTVIAHHTQSSHTLVNTTDYGVAGGSVATTDKKLTVKTNFTAKNSQSFTCKVVYKDPDTDFEVVLLATKEITKITNGVTGVNAVTAFITNSAVTLPALVNGAVSVYTGSGTDIYVYDGSTTLKYVSTAPANGEFNVSTSVAPASGVTVGSISAQGTAGSNNQRATVANITAFAQAQDVVTVTYTITGKTLMGTAINATQMQTFSKAKAGAVGNDSVVYNLTPSTNVIQKSQAGATAPASVVFTGFTTTGNAQPVSTANGYKFVIDKSINNGAFENNVASPTTGASVSFATNVTNLSAVRCRMYRVGDTPTVSNWVDEETVYVISEGVDAYYLNVNTPNGDTIRNGQGEILVQADLYKGAGTIAPTATKWYIQDPIATTGSGGDSDGGNGWRLIKTIANPTANSTLALVANAGSTTPVGTYYVKYTWCGQSGETIGNTTQQSLAVTAGNDLRVTVPTFPADVTKARVYAGLTSGDANLKYQGDITVSAGNLVLTKLYTDTEVIPTTSTASIASNATSITVRNWAIQGVEGFKCVATSGNKYSGVVIVRDLTDPIMVQINGDQFFKNGQGSVTLSATLIQDGSQISTAGYTFQWSVYNSDGNLNKILNGQTGATCIVLADDVNGKGYIVCDAIK